MQRGGESVGGNLARVSCLMATHLYRVFAWGRVDEMGHKLAVPCPYPSQISFFTGEVKGRLAYIYIFIYLQILYAYIYIPVIHDIHFALI